LHQTLNDMIPSKHTAEEDKKEVEKHLWKHFVLEFNNIFLELIQSRNKVMTYLDSNYRVENVLPLSNKVYNTSDNISCWK